MGNLTTIIPDVMRLGNEELARQAMMAERMQKHPSPEVQKEAFALSFELHGETARREVC